MIESLSLMNGPIEADDDFNLTVVRTDEAVLLGRKTRGFGEGKLVLPGGKTRYYVGESGVALIPFAEEAAREACEETGLAITGTQLSQKGILHLADEDDTKTVRLYEARLDSTPAVSSTELADLEWRSAETLPYDEMPEDYKLWLPHILSGYAVNAFLVTNLGRIVNANIYRQKLMPLGRMEEVPFDLITYRPSGSPKS